MTTFILVVDVVPPTPKIAVDPDPVEVHRVGQGEPEPEGFFTSDIVTLYLGVGHGTRPKNSHKVVLCHKAIILQ